LNQISRVAVDLFMVMKWIPGAPSSSRRWHSSLACSMPIARTAAGSSATDSNRSLSFDGNGAPDSCAERSIVRIVVTGMMPGSADFEMIGAWRFHRRGTAVGTRFESTAYAGAILPGVQRPAGMARDLKRRPGVYSAVSTGMASRSHYAWAGAGYTRFGEAEGRLVLGCAEGALAIGELQPAGGRWMAASDYLRGHGAPEAAASA